MILKKFDSLNNDPKSIKCFKITFKLKNISLLKNKKDFCEIIENQLLKISLGKRKCVFDYFVIFLKNEDEILIYCSFQPFNITKRPLNFQTEVTTLLEEKIQLNSLQISVLESKRLIEELSVCFCSEEWNFLDFPKLTQVIY